MNVFKSAVAGLFLGGIGLPLAVWVFWVVSGSEEPNSNTLAWSFILALLPGAFIGFIVGIVVGGIRAYCWSRRRGKNTIKAENQSSNNGKLNT